MRHRRRTYSLLVFLLFWIRVNSQVIHDSPPIDVALTRPILPWLARYFVGAGKSTVFLDNPQSANVTSDNKIMHPTLIPPKSTLRRAEAIEDPKPEAPPVEEEKPVEEPPKEEVVADPMPPPEEPKPEEVTEPPPDPPKEDETPPPSDPVADPPPETPKDVVTSPPALPFIVPPNMPPQMKPGYYYDGAFGPIASAARGIQGVPVAPSASAPFYNMPYIYYPAPLPAYPASYPYPAPIVSQPTLAVPTTPQPLIPVTITFPPMPSPKPIVLEAPTPQIWPPMPDPIPINSITLPVVTTIQPLISAIPQPILPPCLPPFPQIPFFSMPAHSVIPFNSGMPPCSYMGQPLMSAPMASPSVVSPKYFYRNIGNAKPPESRRQHPMYMQGNYKNN